MLTTSGWNRLAEVAASQHGVFNRSDAHAHGIGSRALRRAIDRGQIAQVIKGVFRFRWSAPSWHQHLKAHDLIGLHVATRAAGALHRLDRMPPGKREFVVLRGSERRVSPPAVLHRTKVLEAEDLTTIDGISCTTIERTLVDLAQVLPIQAVEPALDSALRAGVSEESIKDTLDRVMRPGKTGVVPLRQLLDDPARAGRLPDSLFERLLERILVDHRFPRPVRQYEIELPTGRRRVDLAWPRVKVAVEAHSRSFHFGRAADDEDHRRDLELAAAGWEVVYVTWNMAQEPDFFLQLLSAVLNRRQAAAGTAGG